MRWKCSLAYEGTDFVGWQIQPTGPTVQQAMEKRLGEIFGHPVPVTGAGRTDSGVHARGQVFHFDGEWAHAPEKLYRALQIRLPSAIQVLTVEPAAPDFHSRYQAVRKRYVYQFFEGQASPFESRYFWSIGPHRLDEAAMNAAARLLLGPHDFAAFTANNPGRTEDTVRDLLALHVLRDGPRLFLIAEADGFLFRMVRSLAGCLYDVGRGALAPELPAQILASRQRTHLVRTAPAHGLFLEWVQYPPRP